MQNLEIMQSACRIIFRTSTLATIVCFSQPSAAVDLLNTYGSTSVATGNGYFINNPGPGFGGQSEALPFTMSSSATIDTMSVAISGSGTFIVGIMSGATVPSGNFLFSTSFSNTVANSSALLTRLGWSLPAGEYWLVGEGQIGASGVWHGNHLQTYKRWAYTINSANSNWGVNFGTGQWEDSPAAKITASVPEPNTLALITGGGLITITLVRRRAKPRTKVSTNI